MLTAVLGARRAIGQPVIDLTGSNPTICGIDYPRRDIIACFSDAKILTYEPDPRGKLSARDAIVKYYAEKHVDISRTRIFLTSSTSEAYSYLFTLLCDPGECVIVPRPAYPLIDFLAQLNSVNLAYYRLFYDSGWHIDVESIARAVKPSTRAIVIISPHNPAGVFLSNLDFLEICEIARQHNLAILIDEVFADFPLGDGRFSSGDFTRQNDVPVFLLNGISKLAGLPQMKLGWIVFEGNSPEWEDCLNRLEIISDVFLSVNTPVQIALPRLLTAGHIIRDNILTRIRKNYEITRGLMVNGHPCTLLNSEGGWYGILKFPQTRSDEEWALGLLRDCGIYVLPGYLFDFDEGAFSVFSLLTSERLLRPAMEGIIEYAGNHC